MELAVWNIKTHLKGDTFNAVQITFPFEITDCRIDMQFRMGAGSVIFEWSTIDSTIEKITAYKIQLNSRILNAKAGNYVSDLQVTYLDGTVKTYFKAKLRIEQDITIV